MTLKIRIVSILTILSLMILIAPQGSTVSAGGYCDWVSFVADVTVPDGWPVAPGQILEKTWRLQNIGTCWWTPSYKLVFAGGAQMGGVSEVNLPKDVPPGETVDITVGLTAPTVPGRYIGYWKLQNPNGGLFGMGQTATQAFFVEVEVVSQAAPVYDFVANAPLATWITEASGKRPFPGVYGDPNGFVQVVDQPILESGIPSSGKGILMAPPAEYNEHIDGFFPPYEIKEDDRFQALIGCEYGSTGCDVRFVLQYQDPQEPGGNAHTFWAQDKSYKNSFTPVDVKLKSLAGKKLSFRFIIRPNGSTLDDHAIWVNPVIVNSNQTGPEIPTVTPLPVTPTPTISSTLPPSTLCDRAWFLGDVTVPDGTVFAPGETFTKTWKLRNVGSCTWTTDYSLVFSTGDQMGGPVSINLPASVGPREEIDLSVDLVAPATPGSYRGNWLLKNAAGDFFGIGVQWNTLANKPFWVAINVASTSPPVTGYDFVAHVCDAQWTSGIATLPLLPCPYEDVSNGTIKVVDNPHLENDTIDTRPALLTVPQNVYNGYMQGIYPPFTVQEGDHFKSLINCEFGQRDCYVAYRLDYQVDNGPIQNFWSFGERYEGLYYQANVDLSPLAGQTVKFILRADANGFPTGDRALWVAPSIVRSGEAYPQMTATPTTPISTSTPIPELTPTFTPVQPTATLQVPTATSAQPTGTLQVPTATPPQPSSTPAQPTATLHVPTATPPQPTATLQPPTAVPTATTLPAAAQGYFNTNYDFQFLFPPNSSLVVFSDNRARITYPFTSGTNLVAKYLDVVVVDGLDPCHTTNFTNPPTSTSSTVINGIPFLVETGVDFAFSNTYTWKAYSTYHNNACISMNFVLQSTDSGAPSYDTIPESSVFEAIMATFKLTNP